MDGISLVGPVDTAADRSDSRPAVGPTMNSASLAVDETVILLTLCLRHY